MIALGPRAGVIMGMIQTPVSVSEIYYAIRKAVNDDGYLDELDANEIGGSPAVALRSLDIGGASGIATVLDRLREFGLADFVADPDGDHERGRLWYRTAA